MTAIAELPAWVSEHAPKDRARRSQPADTATAIGELDTQANVDRATEWLTTRAPESGTFTVGAKVKDFGISRDKCLELVMDHWPPAEAKGEEHIAFRIDNVYRYGQNAPGIASAEAEFDAVEIDETKAPPKKKGLHFTTWRDLKPNFDQPYLIDGILDLGTMAVTYGDSNTGKTYVKLDQAFHIAAGKNWNGHKVQQGAVVYIAAEGGTGFGKRAAAFKIKYGIETLPFAVVPCPVDMFSDNGDTAKLVKLIREVEALFDQNCVLVVVDTLARAMAGGDENTSIDMGKFVMNCDRIRNATGATINVIHHTGKDKAKGARGSSALRAATDTEIEIDVGTLTVTKQRDMAKGEAMGFELESIEIGHRADGKAVTACVVRWVEASEFEARVSPVALDMLAVLQRVYAAECDRVEDDGGAAGPGTAVLWTEWQAASIDVLKGARGKPITRTALFTLRRELAEAGLIEMTKRGTWIPKRDNSDA